MSVYCGIMIGEIACQNGRRTIPVNPACRMAGYPIKDIIIILSFCILCSNRFDTIFVVVRKFGVKILAINIFQHCRDIAIAIVAVHRDMVVVYIIGFNQFGDAASKVVVTDGGYICSGIFRDCQCTGIVIGVGNRAADCITVVLIVLFGSDTTQVVIGIFYTISVTEVKALQVVIFVVRVAVACQKLIAYAYTGTQIKFAVPKTICCRLGR